MFPIFLEQPVFYPPVAAHISGGRAGTGDCPIAVNLSFNYGWKLAGGGFTAAGKSFPDKHSIVIRENFS